MSEIFGGLEVCALELVVGKDGREHIIELNDSATSFMGDSQEEDRRHLAELVLQRMQVCNYANPYFEKNTLLYSK